MSIAGNLQNLGVSRGLDATATRLRTSDSTSDSKKQGVRIALFGGRHPLESGGREQRAIVEMLCDPDKTGKEGEWDTSKDGYEKVPAETDPDSVVRLRRAEGDGQEGGDGTSEHQLLKPDSALVFDSYGPLADNANVDVLRLTWHTKLACENRVDDGNSGKSEHWGFFTWFIILWVSLVLTLPAGVKVSLTSCYAVSFWVRHRTSSSAPGSITTATARGAGTCCLTVIH